MSFPFTSYFDVRKISKYTDLNIVKRTEKNKTGLKRIVSAQMDRKFCFPICIYFWKIVTSDYNLVNIRLQLSVSVIK